MINIDAKAMQMRTASWDGTATIVWVDTTTVADFVYYVYRHRTGNVYELVHFSRAFATPTPMAVMYSYVDSAPCGDEVTYEVMKYNKTSGTYVSRTISVIITCDVTINDNP